MSFVYVFSIISEYQIHNNVLPNILIVHEISTSCTIVFLEDYITYTYM